MPERYVYVVLVDWGTVDGYPNQVHVHDVFQDEGAADEALARCKNREAYPAVWGKVERHRIRHE